MFKNMNLNLGLCG